MQHLALVRVVVQAGCSFSVEKVLELVHAALGPSKAALGVTQVRHDEPIFPRAVSGARTTQVAWRRRTVVDTAKSVDVASRLSRLASTRCKVR